jgi:hypothetical protein
MDNKCRIVRRKIPKITLKKYGWKSPIYYEVMKGKSRVAVTNTKKEALKWKKRNC